MALMAALAATACESDSEPSFRASPLAQALPGAAFEDPHAGGTSAGIDLEELAYGRLVDVYDRSSEQGEPVLQYTDLLVNPALTSDGVDFELDHHAGRERLVILHAGASEAFAAALERARANLPRIPVGLSGSALTQAVPRDAALSLRFSDLLDAASIDASALHVGPGGLGGLGGAAVPVRVVADANHGGYADLDGNGELEFYTTRLIVDPVASRLDQLRDEQLARPLAALSGGWQHTGATVELELALQADASGVRNAAGAQLSGGRTLVQSFLASSGSLGASGGPRVLGEQGIDITSVLDFGGGRYLLTFGFDNSSCASRPERGDLIEFAGAIVEVVTSDQGFDPSSGSINTRAALLGGSGSGVVPGAALFVSPFDPAKDSPECFVSFSPAPTTPIQTGQAVQGVSADASVAVRFDRPMDPASFEALRTMTVERGWSAPALEEKVVGLISASANLDRFSFDPSVPLSTVAPVSPAAYVFDLDGSATGVLGAHGAPLQDDLPAVSFTLDPNQANVTSSGIVLEFDEVDEDGNGSPELRGQFVQDLGAEGIRSRQVVHFSGSLDSTNTSVGVMVPISSGVQTPLSPLGSKLTSVWRYFDMGFSLLDENYHNIDVEGLYWSPNGGQVFDDQFSEFEMSLGHAGFLPDEDVNTGLLPKFPQSGLSNTFDQNYLGQTAPKVVHPKSAGYHVDPIDLEFSSAGTALMPWPLNRDIPTSQFEYWTWRDTGITEVGAPNGVGADPARVSSIWPSSNQGLYSENEVPSIGLPLLTEFRTYADSNASGLNALRVAIAINSSATPFFRTFSTGGVLSNGSTLVVDPDLETQGGGGVNGVGVKTPSRDNAFYLGQADFVVRVSRAHTVWFDTSTAQSFGVPVIEPAASSQPAGTSVSLAFRGAQAITSPVPNQWESTEWIDVYGDSYDQSQLNKLLGPPDAYFQVSYLNGDSGWKSDLSELDGARYVQARITMIANAETGEAPSIAGIGIPFVN